MEFFPELDASELMRVTLAVHIGGYALSFAKWCVGTKVCMPWFGLKILGLGLEWTADLLFE